MTSIIDTDRDVTDQVQELKAVGIASIGRYLDCVDPDEAKVVKPDEALAIAGARLRLFLIYEIGGTPSGSEQGNQDGVWTADYMPTVGAPPGAAVYYAVDYDAQAADMPGILQAFQAFQAPVVAAGFRVGVYGSGDVCSAVISAGYATLSMLSCSTGWSGYDSYKASNQWALLQCLSQPIRDVPCDTDVANGDFGDFLPFAEMQVAAAS
jgi:hypothetical protein